MRRSLPSSFPASDNPEAKEKSATRPEPGKLQRLRRQRDELYEEARDNPGSDASEMVRALLLSGILSTQTEAEEDELVRRSLEEERRQQRLGRRQAAKETAAKTLPGRAQAERIERRLRETEAALKEVARVAAEAAARPAMDVAVVYRRIAEIIGLQPAAEVARAPEGGAGTEEPDKQDVGSGG